MRHGMKICFFITLRLPENADRSIKEHRSNVTMMIPEDSIVHPLPRDRNWVDAFEEMNNKLRTEVLTNPLNLSINAIRISQIYYDYQIETEKSLPSSFSAFFVQESGGFAEQIDGNLQMIISFMRDHCSQTR
jgi:hypothetical protein